jgi:hypothetical protein
VAHAPEEHIHAVLIGRDSTTWMPEHAEAGIPSFKRTVAAVGVVPLQENLAPKRINALFKSGQPTF